MSNPDRSGPGATDLVGTAGAADPRSRAPAVIRPKIAPTLLPVILVRVVLARALWLAKAVAGGPSHQPHPESGDDHAGVDPSRGLQRTGGSRRWPRLLLLLPLGLLAPLVAAPAATSAHELEPYHVQVQAGPYPVEVGFSEWPVFAERAVDITFMPEGGIADKTASIAFVSPAADDTFDGLDVPLGRHPRQREFWGLDLFAFPTEGDWTLALSVDGPAGPGVTTLPLPVGPRPGPPPLPMWLLGILPAVAVVALIVGGWRGVRPGRTAEAGAWT